MDAKELRLGNYIYDFENKIISIVFIEHDRVYCDNNKEYDILSIDPISLTEQWLKEFGFEEKDQYYELVIDTRITLRYSEGNPNCMDITQDHNVIGMRWAAINEVHKLQNLYHILTGKELIRNE